MNKVGRPPKRTLDYQEREGLKEDIAMRESMVNAASEPGTMEYTPTSLPEISLNKDRIKEGVDALKKTLEEGSPEKATGNQRHLMEKKCKELEERFKPFLETWEEIELLRHDDPKFRKAVRKNLERQKVEPLIHEWKECRRRLDPENPEADSLDGIREEK